jgi:predicted HD phosphohydrolase
LIRTLQVDEAAAFTQEPYWEGAVALRRIDELAKDPNGPMPQFGEFSAEILQAAVA